MWITSDNRTKLAALNAIADDKKIARESVEKDWWVTAVLIALSKVECAPYLLFKGGTSLSKAWRLIDRFSEDVDIAIDRRFFNDVLGLQCAKCETKTQIRNLREASRDYIHGTLSPQLANELNKMGILGYSITNITTRNAGEPLDHDTDPTAISINYPTIVQSKIPKVMPSVKLEIGCMSMAEPYEQREITSLIGEYFHEIDGKMKVAFKTVTPTRTLIEKVLLLNEEFQKNKPRASRMSRHLYDIERMMSTEYGMQSIADISLLSSIVEHRRIFYHLKYVDYDKNYPPYLKFCPTGELKEKFRDDYEGSMVHSYIYGDALPFEELMGRLQSFQNYLNGVATVKYH